jgi:RNA polymerase sigma factor (TIGR02999 family)
MSSEPVRVENDSTADVTRLLHHAAAGKSAATQDLFDAVYDQLRQIARRRMAEERNDHTLQPTALVHEAYLRLVGDQQIRWNSRAHFYGAAARAMRRILVEHARRRARPKHGGDRERIPLSQSPGQIAVAPPSDEILAVDEALSRLEAADPRKGTIVNLRYFAGLTAEQTARVVGVSVGTIEREWRFIKSWLQLELTERERR